jgi:mannose-6-phosphate isomerase-like protein (cupin superfamily)/heme-degrading monooxygenase HmoA
MSTPKKLFLILSIFGSVAAGAQPTKNRVIPNDPAKYRQLTAVHAGAGAMGFTQLVGSQDLSTNFLYLHAGVIPANAGIGHHFHHNIEEMYVLLDGEAEFTINGRTSKIKAPALVPCKMGDAHAIYNSSGKPVRWLNFGVSLYKSKADNFDLGDNRVGAAIDPIPTFVSARLERDKLKPNNPAYTGSGIMYRRVFGPEIFHTNWDHVDHVIIPAGSKAGPRWMDGFEEVYYVMNGTGSVSINADKAPIATADAFYGLSGDEVIIANEGKEDLEILVVGVAATKQKPASLAAFPVKAKAKAMALQMDFVVPKENAEAFEKMYYTIYVPAMKVQKGYLSSKLLRTFAADLEKEIEGEPTTYNYQIQISFDTEEDRRLWVASEQHIKSAWPAASGLSKEFKWRGYDVMGEDNQ